MEPKGNMTVWIVFERFEFAFFILGFWHVRVSHTHHICYYTRIERLLIKCGVWVVVSTLSDGDINCCSESEHLVRMDICRTMSLILTSWDKRGRDDRQCLPPQIDEFVRYDFDRGTVRDFYDGFMGLIWSEVWGGLDIRCWLFMLSFTFRQYHYVVLIVT